MESIMEQWKEDRVRRWKVRFWLIQSIIFAFNSWYQLLSWVNPSRTQILPVVIEVTISVLLQALLGSVMTTLRENSSHFKVAWAILSFILMLVNVVMLIFWIGLQNK